MPDQVIGASSPAFSLHSFTTGEPALIINFCTFRETVSGVERVWASHSPPHRDN